MSGAEIGLIARTPSAGFNPYASLCVMRVHLEEVCKATVIRNSCKQRNKGPLHSPVCDPLPLLPACKAKGLATWGLESLLRACEIGFSWITWKGGAEPTLGMMRELR